MSSPLTKLAHIPAQIASDVVLVASVVSVISIYVMGLLANKYSVYKLMRNSLFLILPAAALCYYLIGQQSNLILGLALFAVFQGFLVVLPTIVISYLFPVNIRLTGVALAYNISFVLFGGLTPIVITSIIAETTGLVLFVPFGVLLVTVAFAYWALRRSREYMVE